MILFSVQVVSEFVPRLLRVTIIWCSIFCHSVERNTEWYSLYIQLRTTTKNVYSPVNLRLIFFFIYIFVIKYISISGLHCSYLHHIKTSDFSTFLECKGIYCWWLRTVRLKKLLAKSIYTFRNFSGAHRGQLHDDFRVKIKIAEPDLFSTSSCFVHFLDPWELWALLYLLHFFTCGIKFYSWRSLWSKLSSDTIMAMV